MISESASSVDRALFESNDARAIINPRNLTIVDANLSFLRMTGIERETALGMSIAGFLEFESYAAQERILSACRNLLSHTAREECIVITNTGFKIPVSVSVRNLPIQPEPMAIVALRDITELREATRRESNRRGVLEKLAKTTTLQDMLDAVVGFVETEMPDSICSILLLDESGKHLQRGASSKLPEFYIAAIHGIPIGPNVGSCGTAAYWNRRVVTESMLDDPNWAIAVDVAIRAGLHSCWSEPICATSGRVLGTFAIYHSVPYAPSESHLELIEIAAHLASIAIERDRTERDIHRHAKQLEDTQTMAKLSNWEWDIVQDTVHLSDQCYDTFGLDKSTFEPKFETCVNCIHPEGRERVRKLVLESLTTHNHFQFEEKIIRPDGGERWVDFRAEVHRDEYGKPSKLSGYSQDVTGRVSAAQALKKSEQQFRTLFEKSPEAIFVEDTAGFVLAANEEACRLQEMSLAQLIGMNVLELVPPEMVDCVVIEFHKLVRGEVIQAEGVSLTSSGKRIPVEIRVNPIEYGGQNALLLHVRDITPRKRAEIALSESEEFNRQIIGSLQEGLAVFDRDLRYVVWNQFLVDLSGISSGSILGKHPDEVFPWMREQGAIAGLERALQGETIVQPDVLTRQNSSGEQHWIAGRVGPLRDASGNVVGVIASLQDVTARKRGEEERRKLELQMQYTQKLESLGVLAGGIAHDFNNLLTTIMGYAELAQLDTVKGTDAHRHIEEVIQGATRAAELTQQMLAYSGRGSLNRDVLNLSDLVRDTGHLLHVSISKKCELRYDLATDLPSVEVDASQMRQIIMNLIINSSEAIGDHNGTITVRTGTLDCTREYLANSHFSESLDEGKYVYLDVIDTGSGMTAEIREKIFEPFFTTKFTGRGLGLAAVLGIVRGHNGTILCESEPGVGTKSRVLLPISELPVRVPLITQALHTDWRGSGTILVVDDETSVRELAAQLLESMGFETVTAKDGLEAIRIYRDAPSQFRMVLLDLTMPHMDGAETMMELHRIQSDAIVVLTSGYNEQATTNRLEGAGMSGFIQKPYRYEDLLETIRRVLGS